MASVNELVERATKATPNAQSWYVDGVNAVEFQRIIAKFREMREWIQRAIDNDLEGRTSISGMRLLASLDEPGE